MKNSGKTALIEAMLPHLTAAGLRAAVIKHDGHRFLPEPPDTDTGRFLAAGAWGTAIFDGEKYKVVRREVVDEAALIAQFPEADLILLEGFKYSSWPKLEVVRAGNSAAPVSDPATLLALGVKHIYLGPTLPAFISPNILNYLVENYGIAPITTPEEDLEALLKYSNSTL